MKLSKIAIGATAVVATVLAVAPQAQQPAMTDDQIRAAFVAADVNRDGNIDVDEAIADAIRVFGAYDTNRDGFLTLSELPRHSPERFKRADRDGDGRLSVGEVAADRVLEFFMIDTDRNGVITLAEVRAFVEAQRNQRK